MMRIIYKTLYLIKLKIMESNYFGKLFNYVKCKGSRVERDYGTVGGIWTVNTWKLNNIIVNVMDEGYTDRIYVRDKLDVCRSYKGELSFSLGDIGTLKSIYEEVVNKEG